MANNRISKCQEIGIWQSKKEDVYLLYHIFYYN